MRRQPQAGAFEKTPFKIASFNTVSLKCVEICLFTSTDKNMALQIAVNFSFWAKTE
jgi:hypothetical protein